MVDTLGIFLRDISRDCPKLSAAEERDLGEKWRDEADVQARDTLIRSILPWCVRQTRRFYRSRVDKETLISLAMEGAIAAVDHFDPGKGRLTTLVVWHVKRKILHYLGSEQQVIRVPLYHSYGGANGSDHGSTEVQKRAQAVLQGVLSLEMPLDGHIGDLTLGTTLVDRKPGPLDELADREQEATRFRLRELIDRLPKTERTIMLGRLRGDKLWEVGRALGISKERTRQLETRALAYLKIMSGQPLTPKERTAVPTASLFVSPSNPSSYGSFAEHPSPALSPLDVSQFDLTRLLETLDSREVRQAMAKCEAEFAIARNKYQSHMKSLRVILAAIDARDGKQHGSRRKPQAAADSPAAKEPEAAGLRHRGRPTHKGRIADYLLTHGPTDSRAIVDATGINGSSVSAALTTNPNTFDKSDKGWDLTKHVRDSLSKQPHLNATNATQR